MLRESRGLYNKTMKRDTGKYLGYTNTNDLSNRI